MENKLANVFHLTLIPIHDLYAICFWSKRYKFQFSVKGVVIIYSYDQNNLLIFYFGQKGGQYL